MNTRFQQYNWSESTSWTPRTFKATARDAVARTGTDHAETEGGETFSVSPALRISLSHRERRVCAMRATSPCVGVPNGTISRRYA